MRGGDLARGEVQRGAGPAFTNDCASALETFSPAMSVGLPSPRSGSVSLDLRVAGGQLARHELLGDVSGVVLTMKTIEFETSRSDTSEMVAETYSPLRTRCLSASDTPMSVSTASAVGWAWAMDASPSRPVATSVESAPRDCA